MTKSVSDQPSQEIAKFVFQHECIKKTQVGPVRRKYRFSWKTRMFQRPHPYQRNLITSRINITLPTRLIAASCDLAERSFLLLQRGPETTGCMQHDVASRTIDFMLLNEDESAPALASRHHVISLGQPVELELEKNILYDLIHYGEWINHEFPGKGSVIQLSFIQHAQVFTSMLHTHRQAMYSGESQLIATTKRQFRLFVAMSCARKLSSRFEMGRKVFCSVPGLSLFDIATTPFTSTGDRTRKVKHEDTMPLSDGQRALLSRLGCLSRYKLRDEMLVFDKFGRRRLAKATVMVIKEMETTLGQVMRLNEKITELLDPRDCRDVPPSLIDELTVACDKMGSAYDDLLDLQAEFYRKPEVNYMLKHFSQTFASRSNDILDICRSCSSIKEMHVKHTPLWQSEDEEYAILAYQVETKGAGRAVHVWISRILTEWRALSCLLGRDLSYSSIRDSIKLMDVKVADSHV